MRYDRWKYLYPPRPDYAIASAMLRYYEQRGWQAQAKKNGTNTIIGISPDKEFIAMNRHKAEHKAWQLTPHIKSELLRLFPERAWFVLCAEIMHSKTVEIKNTIYIHDVLVWKSDFLLGSTFPDRQKLLEDRLVTNVEAWSHYVCDSDNKIWFAKRFTKNFKELFVSIKNPKIDEGLVLKNPAGTLHLCLRPDDNSGWQLKCRHPSKHYSF